MKIQCNKGIKKSIITLLHHPDLKVLSTIIIKVQQKYQGQSPTGR
jgi:hypothetical protein